jgi:type IV pilus assembly protein PilQ
MVSRTVAVSLMVCGLLGWAEAAYAESAPGEKTGNVITALDVQTAGQCTQVVLRGDKVPTFTVFKLLNPDRLVVDLIRTDLKGVDAPRAVEDARVGQIATTQFQQAGNDVSRVIIGLKPGVRFDARTDGNNVVVGICSKEALPSAFPGAVKAEGNETKVSSDLAEPSNNEKGEKGVPSKEVAENAADKPKPEEAVKDYRVVESHGDKGKASRVTVKRIVNAKDDAITILTTGDVTAYEVLEVTNPLRLVVDIFGATMKTKVQERQLSGKNASRIRAALHPDRVRLVLDVKGTESSYRVEKSKQGIQIAFAKKAAPTQPSALASAPTEPAKPAAAAEPVSTLNDLMFKQDADRARVVLDLQGESSPQVVYTDDHSTILEIPHCQMPILLERTLDTSEFGSDVQSLSAYRVQGDQKVKIVGVTSSRLSSRLERRDGKLEWILEAPVKKSEKEGTKSAEAVLESTEYTYAPSEVAGYSVRKPDLEADAAGGGATGGEKKSKYHGQRMSLDFKDIDIHDVLRLISDVAKVNIITSDDVSGKVSMNLRNVPWDQALDIILRTKKLGKVQYGNIIRVAKQDDLFQEQEQAQKIAEAMKPLEPLRVRIISVNYATADEVEKQVKDILSARGSVTVDKRTNVLIIKDVLENLVKAEGLVRSLDTETPQVLIEARIVEANTNFLRDVGVQWGGDMNFSPAYGNATGLPFPNSVGVTGGVDAAESNTVNSGTANPGHFAVNLPAAVGFGSGGAVGFIFGSASGSTRLNLRLSALENKGAVKIVSAPKITTLDNHKAKIGQGVSIPISVVSAAGVNTTFVEANLALEVTPHITQEGSILMAIKVTKNEPDFSRTGSKGDPTILKKEAETQVMVKDGDTTVIGGIYTRKTSDTFSGIPVLSHIPILGWFFRDTKYNDERTELLIFITPRIVNRLQSTISTK